MLQQGTSGTSTSHAEGISPWPLQVGHVEPSVQTPRPRQLGHFFALKTLAIAFTRMRETGRQLWTSKSAQVLEQPSLPSGRDNAEVIVSELGSYTSSWGSIEESDLDEERLVDVFDCVGIFG